MSKTKKKKIPIILSNELLQNKPLEEQLNLKDLALASSAEGITIADATKPDCPLIYVNKGFEKITGYPADFASGTNCRFLQGEDTDPTAIEEIRRAVKEKRGCIVEILNYRKNGEPFWNRLSITPIHNDAGVVTHFVGIQSDVTTRRNAEDALRISNTKLENANNLIRNDLQFAAKIQKSFLPPSITNFNNVFASWELISCDELAGDTLNVFDLDGQHIIFYVIDVSGHGVQAALLSVTLNRWLSPRSTSLKISNVSNNEDDISVISPVEVMERLNKQFPIDPNTGQYFTIIYGMYDVVSKEFCFVSAGHPKPVYLPKGSSPIMLESNNFPIGVVPEPEFAESRIKMSSGDRMYLYSDGLVDAQNSSEEEFGDERLLKEISSSKTYSLQESINSIISKSTEWSDDKTFKDDISILGFEIK